MLVCSYASFYNRSLWDCVQRTTNGLEQHCHEGRGFEDTERLTKSTFHICAFLKQVSRRYMYLQIHPNLLMFIAEWTHAQSPMIRTPSRFYFKRVDTQVN